MTETEMPEHDSAEHDSHESNAAEPEASNREPVEKVDQGSRWAGLSLVAMLLAFVLGLLIGYVARPFTDQLATTVQSDPPTSPQAIIAVEPTIETAAVAEATSEPASEESTEGVAVEEGGDSPMLITPTPDRSAAIAAAILPNVRHFVGDENAPVTLIEFSDFQ